MDPRLRRQRQGEGAAAGEKIGGGLRASDGSEHARLQSSFAIGGWLQKRIRWQFDGGVAEATSGQRSSISVSPLAVIRAMFRRSAQPASSEISFVVAKRFQPRTTSKPVSVSVT